MKEYTICLAAEIFVEITIEAENRAQAEQETIQGLGLSAGINGLGHHVVAIDFPAGEITNIDEASGEIEILSSNQEKE